MMKKWLRRLILVLTIPLLLSACSPGYQEPGPATAAVQLTRAAALGTSIARDLQRTSTLQAVQDAQLATATAEAIQANLSVARSWPVALEETFDTIERWPSGSDSSERADGSWSLVDGRYRWDVTSKLDLAWWVYPDQEPSQDFYLSVEMAMISGPETAKQGVIFRRRNDSNFYLLEITAAGEAWLYLLKDDQWSELLPGWQVSLPPAGSMLRVEVIGRGRDFLLMIGDAAPVAFQDSTLARGEAGVYIGLNEGGQQASWEFDNFILRVP